jgi:hypothetical protein
MTKVLHVELKLTVPDDTDDQAADELTGDICALLDNGSHRWSCDAVVDWGWAGQVRAWRA